jgi:hypothetical protein
MNRLEILISILYRTAKFFLRLMESELGCGKDKIKSRR